MPNVLIVDDDGLVASALQGAIECVGSFRVVALVDDLASALAASKAHDVDVALVDIQLGWNCTGYSVAAALSALNIPCVFVTGNAPPFPLPEFAIGCVSKPFTVEAISAALALATPLPSSALITMPVPAYASGFERY